MLRQLIPLQAAQQNLLIWERLYPEAMVNHRSVATEINGPVDENILSYALKQVIKRHDIFRAKLVESPPGFLEITPSLPDAHPLQLIDATSLQGTHPVEALYETLQLLEQENFIKQPFDLYHGPLWRCALIKIAENKFQFLMLFNHIIIDETSIGIVMKDLSAYFQHAMLDETVPKLDSIPSAVDIDISLNDTEQEKRIAYWEKKLAHFTTLHLPTDYAKLPSSNFTGKRFRFSIDAELIKQLKSNPNLYPKYSLNQMISASLYSLLYRYSGDTDICIGMTSANRRHAVNITHSVNCFFNSIPLRVIFSKESTFSELLAEVKKNVGDALKNQLPLDVVFKKALELNAKNSQQTASPYKVLLVVNEIKPTLTIPNATSTPTVELDLGVCKFPYYGINLDELEDGSYRGFVEYNTNLFSEPTIHRLVSHLKKTLQAMKNPDCPIHSVPLLLEEEVSLIEDLNATEKEPHFTGYLPDALHEQALLCPDNNFTSFHHEDGRLDTLSYSQFDNVTTKIANYLTECGVTSGTVVAISLTRCLLLPVAIFAAWKAGANIVTLESEQCEALTHKMNTTHPAFVICDNLTQSFFTTQRTQCIDLTDATTLLKIDKSSAVYTTRIESPDEIAYTMHTSGSAAAPKAVTLTYGGLSNSLDDCWDKYKKQESLLGTALPTFDAFIWDYLVAIATQGEVDFSFDKGRYSPQVNEDIIRKRNITFLVTLPNFLSQLNPNSSIKHIISMGAVPHEETLALWAQTPDRIVENGYGHTETGICLSTQRFIPGLDHTLVGRPIRNMKIFILDALLGLCPVGVTGEIYVSGPGLANGYLNNPELTKTKFITVAYNPVNQRFDPCSKTDPNHMRLYATGDLGSYQALNNKQGCVKFVGRKDRQIKLNGLRIDLDEIENILRANLNIHDAVILSNADNTALSAYIIPMNNAVTFEEIRKQFYQSLSKTFLPPSAYPRTLNVVSALPITQNGKVDMRLLGSPVLLPPPIPQHLTSQQKKICQIWSEVIGIPEENIGIHQAYKELGGDSLSLATLETALNKALPLNSHAGINILSTEITIKILEEKLRPLLKKAITIPPNTYRDGRYIVFTHSNNQVDSPEDTTLDSSLSDSPLPTEPSGRDSPF